MNFREQLSLALTAYFSIALSPAVFGACAERDLAERHDDSELIFTGTVSAVFETCELLMENRVAGETCSGGVQLARVTVDAIYKDARSLQSKSNLLVLADGGGEGLHVYPNGQYLIFGNYSVGSMVTAPACRGSKSLDRAAEEIQQLERIREAFNETVR